MKIIVRFIFIVPLLTLFSIDILNGQDIIILKSGDEHQVKVIEISSEIVKYKKWDNQQGPDYISSKSDIFMIKYSNGTKDVFNQTSTSTSPNSSNNLASGTDQIIIQAKDYMSSVIAEESKGALKLIDLKKLNGVQQNIFGQRVYAISYSLTVEAQYNFWKHSAGGFGQDWYWDSYYVNNGPVDIYAQTFQGIQSKQYSKSSQIEIEGSISFAESDNGWLPTGISSFSNGYGNSSSRDIRSSEPAKTENSTPSSSNSSISATTKNATIDNYNGEYLNGKRNGNGNMLYTNGDYYDGFWKDDERDSTGMMVYANGDVYEGEWSMGKRQGKGKLSLSSSGPKNFKEGVWVNNVLHGQGIYVVDIEGGAKITYKGEFKNGSLYNGVEETLAGNRKVKSANIYVNGVRGENKLVKE